jgi:hypothetical protein
MKKIERLLATSLLIVCVAFPALAGDVHTVPAPQPPPPTLEPGYDSSSDTTSTSQDTTTPSEVELTQALIDAFLTALGAALP